MQKCRCGAQDMTSEYEVAVDDEGFTSCCGAQSTFHDDDLCCKCCWASVTGGVVHQPISFRLKMEG